jgi:pimeloyl-ACP methyl ester carboxylesterase
MPTARRTRPVNVSVDGVTLSGWMAEPDGPPRALVVALHGHGMTARYFAGPADPELSLLEVGAALGFTVWAPDRLGYGASAGADPASFAMFPQAEFLHAALARFAEDRPLGAGCFLLGHSFGLKLALTMAAFPGTLPLLGVDGSGSGLMYTFEPGAERPESQPGDFNVSWGPRHLYPDGTFVFGVLPVATMAPMPDAEAAEWPDDLRRFADGIRVPVRFTFADHERLWVVSEEHFSALRAVLVKCPRVEVAIQRGTGHNISLSKMARAYHAKALAFAEECILDSTDGLASEGSPGGPEAGA